MPPAILLPKPSLLLIFLVVSFSGLKAQPPMPSSSEKVRNISNVENETLRSAPYNKNGKNTSLPSINKVINHRPEAAEICDNNLDDDNNGLVDQNDFACYFSSNNTDDCPSSKIVWCATDSGIVWADIETGKERLASNMDGMILDDLTWASNGKLYGFDHSTVEIYEIDPTTFATRRVGKIPGYNFTNAMTGDGQGNLYMAAYSMYGVWHVIKFNPLNSEVTYIANLNNANLLGLTSAGDLTFLNGELYLVSVGGVIARINPGTGKIIASILTNQPSYLSGFGLTTLNDGYLYISSDDELYQIDPITMSVSDGPYYTFKYPGMLIRGLATYAENCNAPVCKARVSISTLSDPPFCTGPGVWLRANGSGIVGQNAYQWTLPGGGTESNDSVLAKISGRYFVRYFTIPDSCGAKDSIDIILSPAPKVNLGPDTILCPGSQIKLASENSPGYSEYLWQDGSRSEENTIKLPGIYWLRAYNECGSSTDTIIVNPGAYPQVTLGVDTAICPGSVLVINNYATKQSEDKYTWSTASSDNSINVNTAGIYWLESNNSCGTKTDSLFVDLKDSCSCFPVYPAVNLGKDQMICDYETTVLRNLSHQEGFNYHWQNGSKNQSLTATTPGIYWVEISNYCGIARDSIEITTKTEGCQRNVYIPTAFTPNQDGKNDIFKPTIFGELREYELIIYNRWGQVVFQTQDLHKGWDGTFKGKNQNSDSFIWSCSYRFQGNQKLYKKGLVILIR